MYIGGKGGVGKTTCAAAMAVASAAAGARTLLVSTDPAPSLRNVFGRAVGPNPRATRLARGRLEAAEIDAARALERWLAPRTPLLEAIASRGTWLDREDVSRLLALTLPGIDEIAALLEILRLARSGRYDSVVVDTAPTGHTLRMLRMPQMLRATARVFDHMQAKHRAVVEAIRGSWQPDDADRLIEELDRDGAELSELLRNPTRVLLAWVTLPEPMAVEETGDAIAALGHDGIAVRQLIVNRLTPAPPDACQWCSARRQFEREALADMRKRWPAMPLFGVAARAAEPRGVRALQAVASELTLPVETPPRIKRVQRVVRVEAGPGKPAPLLGAPPVCLAMFGGKGGVGKTTCAAASAIDAAARFRHRRVLLISTDPAHSLADVFGHHVPDQPRTIPDGPSNLHVRELDSTKQFAEIRERYTAAIDALFDRLSRGSPFDAAYDRRVMRDLIELAPPGVDELAAVIEVTDALVGSPAEYDLLVMDTAPSGHALRLLETPAIVQDWARALMAVVLKYQPIVGAGDLGRLLLRMSQGIGRLRELLVDPRRTHFVVVTRAAALPRTETIRLLARLKQLRIHAPAVIVNAVGAGTCRNCAGMRRAERKELHALVDAVAGAHRRGGIILAPAQVPPPRGRASLLRWHSSWRVAGRTRGGISSS